MMAPVGSLEVPSDTSGADGSRNVEILRLNVLWGWKRSEAWVSCTVISEFLTSIIPVFSWSPRQRKLLMGAPDGVDPS